MTLPGYETRAVLSRSHQHLVLRATRASDGLSVVIKQPSSLHAPERVRRRLAFEHRMLAKASGPGVVAALDLLQTECGPALILEDFDAENLLLPAGEFLPPEQLIDVARQLTTALRRVHSAGILHKDIKPQNVLMNRRTGEVKLIDFQLATELSRETPDAHFAQPLEGSLAYLSPEQTGRMNRSVDYRSDYYSLGVTLFQLATGSLPLTASDVTGWVHAHISRAPKLASDVQPTVPIMLARLIARLLQKDPSDRYQSSSGLLSDLERCQRALAKDGAIAEFSLGEHDASEYFQVSQRLVGRNAEVRTLLDVFEQAGRGPSRLLLVAGYSGVGKSSLIRELHKPVTERHGRFISGKFDLLERRAPYGALLQAVSQLVQGLLAETDEALASWKSRIVEALGANAQIMIELVPELQRVIGNQPPVATLSPPESRRRFKDVFARFLGLFAREEHPLVVLLDDMQWTDASTPDLLADLLLQHDLHHLMLIAAYRDNEVHEGHLLPAAVRRIRAERPEAVRPISVAPLELHGVEALVADSLRAPADQIAPLARVLYDKTQGNPFFVATLLETLHRQQAIFLRHEHGNWGYDLAQVARAAISDNVVDLLLRSLNALPPEIGSVLSTAACLGSQFDLAGVARLTGRAAADVASLFWQVRSLGLIEPIGDDYRLALAENLGAEGTLGPELRIAYRFRHDRVQQAAYSLIPEAERAAVHLRIGRSLLAEHDPHSEQGLFEVVNHLNLGRGLLESSEQRYELIALNRRAGERAHRAAAYAIAVGYLDVAVSLLAPHAEGSAASDAFDLRYRLAESVHMAGDLGRATLLCNELAALATSPLATASVQLLRARVLESEARFVDSVAAVRVGLRLLGVTLPEDPESIGRAVGAGIGRMQESLAKLGVEALAQLPDLHNPERLMAMHLLFQVIPAAIQTHPPLFLLAELSMFELAAEHGLTPFAAKNFVDCGIIQGGILGNYDVAYRLGKVAFQVLERYGNRAIASGVNFVFAAYVSSWRAPPAEALAAFDEGYRAGAETGDIQHMGFCTALRLHRLLHIGRDLDSVREALEAGIAFLERSRLPSQRTAVILVERALARLAGSERDAGQQAAHDEQATARVLESQNPQWIYAYAEAQMAVSVLLGDYADAQRWSALAGPLVPQAAGLISVPEYHLCDLLVLTQHEWPAAPAERRPGMLEKAKAIQAQLARWSAACPENFAHKYHLASAEVARVEGLSLDIVLEHYDQARRSTAGAYTHMYALALELEARYWRGRGRESLERALLAEARDVYARWGARRKTARLDSAPHDGASSRSGSVDTGQFTRTISRETLAHHSLDVESVLKASRAVASEVRTERLLSRLMTTLLENAAAERGSLILPDTDGGVLRVEVSAEADGESASVAGIPLERADQLCVDAVRYVARSLQPLVVDDARCHPLLGHDQYISEHAIKSLLCLPVLNQGKLVAIFYAENNAATHAFPVERVMSLHLIAGQASVSLVNARLYDNLEEKVEIRTRELATKNLEIVAMLDGMDHGVFSINAELEILPQYSRRVPDLMRSSDVAGRKFLPLLFANSDVGRDAIGAMETALRFSFGSTASLAALNANHLVKAFSRKEPDGKLLDLEVDWKAIAGHDGGVDKFVVVVRDVTEIIRLRQAEQQHASETQLVSRILACGVETFRGFCDAMRRSLELSSQALEGSSQLEASALECLLRELHTVKGNARTLQLTQIVEAVHLAEGACSLPTENGVPGPAERAALRERLVRLEALLEEHEQVAEKNLGALWSQSESPLRAAIEEIDRTLRFHSTRPSQPVRALTEIRQTVQRVQGMSFAEVVADTSRAFDALARELDKHPPELDWTDDGTLVTRDWGQVLKDALTHVFANCLDHGIEPAAERQASGKPARGRIRLATEQLDGRLRIHLSDDGRGLALANLRRRMPEGADRSDDAIAELVFASGVSTAHELTRVSGRGVGMAAVRSSVRARGGDVVLAFTGHEHLGHRPFELIFELPAQALRSAL